MQRFANPLFCAIDTADLDHALTLAGELKGIVGGFKLGLEFFCANGPDGVRRLRDLGAPIFLDLKLHDIPNTVSGAVRAATALGPAMLTVHAAGGTAMLKAAVETAADEAERRDLQRPWVLGVTVLTSLDERDLEALSIEGSSHRVVARLARLAERAGLDGAVCAPNEISTVRSTTRERFKLAVPGIRPKGAPNDDQKRVVAPRAAMETGASLIVVGRPITTADSPARAARSIRESIQDFEASPL